MAMHKAFERGLANGGGAAATPEARNQMSSLAFIQEVETYLRKHQLRLEEPESVLVSKTGDLGIEMTPHCQLLDSINDRSFFNAAQSAAEIIKRHKGDFTPLQSHQSEYQRSS